MKNMKHSLLGLICSCLLFIFLLSNAFVISLRIGIFDNNGAINITGNSAVSSSVTEAIISNSNTILEQYGFTSETFHELMDDDYISTVINTAGTALLSEDEIDLSSIKGDTVEFCNNTSGILVDEFIHNLEASNGKISETTITENPIVQAFSQNYDIDIDAEIKAAISEKYPQADWEKEIDLSGIDTNELRNTLNTAIEAKLYPRLDELTDKIIDKAEEILTEVSNTVHNHPAYRSYNHMIKLISSNITLLIIFLSLCVIFFFTVQFMFYSGIYRNKPFNHLGIAALFAAVPTLITGYCSTIFGNIIDKIINEINGSYAFAGEIVRDILSGCLKPFIYTGFTLLMISATAFILSIVIKPHNS
ncbi:MAG: hypothetical protein HFI34_00360 [Lachnospiraceae bacterium]|nr:hypothetical protein [Lachnospiraceae bacterium]